MTTIAAASPPAPAPAVPAGRAWHVEVAGGLRQAEPAWRALEREAAMSPYGRFDWIAAYVAAHGLDAATRVVAVRDRSGRVALVLPVVVETAFGVRVGRAVGGKHANFNLPLVRSDVAETLTAAEARAMLREAGRALGVDAFAFPNVPERWGGRENPFATGGRRSPSDAWSVPLEADGEATLARSMSAAARKKLRNKSRGLAKAGPLRLLQAGTEAEVDLLLETFWLQKEDRFRDLGISDPFADPAMRAFIRRGALARLDEGCPPVELYGLMAGDRVVAVLGGAADRLRLSGMFVSFDGGEAAKFSPGEILATSVIRRQCELGRAVFDLGVGDARYKQSICDRVETLVDVCVGVTARGRAYAALHAGAIAAKRRVKASPRAMALLTRLRRVLRSGRQPRSTTASR